MELFLHKLAKAGGQLWSKLTEFVIFVKLILLLIVVVVVVSSLKFVVVFVVVVVVPLGKGEILQNIPE